MIDKERLKSITEIWKDRPENEEGVIDEQSAWEVINELITAVEQLQAELQSARDANCRELVEKLEEALKDRQKYMTLWQRDAYADKRRDDYVSYIEGENKRLRKQLERKQKVVDKTYMELEDKYIEIKDLSVEVLDLRKERYEFQAELKLVQAKNEGLRKQLEEAHTALSGLGYEVEDIPTIVELVTEKA